MLRRISSISLHDGATIRLRVKLGNVFELVEK